DVPRAGHWRGPTTHTADDCDEEHAVKEAVKEPAESPYGIPLDTLEAMEPCDEFPVGSPVLVHSFVRMSRRRGQVTNRAKTTMPDTTKPDTTKPDTTKPRKAIGVTTISTSPAGR